MRRKVSAFKRGLRSLCRIRRAACISTCVVILSGAAGAFAAEPASPLTLTVRLDRPVKAISPDLFGIFFEDLSYAADGGLYAELIQNRSFEYHATEQLTWNPLSFWEVVTRGGGRGSVAVGASEPVHPNNPHYVVLDVAEVGEGVGLMNPGFDGIPVREGERYDVAVFARQLYLGRRWGGVYEGTPPPLKARLESRDGRNLGEVTLTGLDWRWKRLTGTITATGSDDAARFVLLATERGGTALDVISLFPQKTFRNRPNGLRADLAQVLADLKPKFVRFPGGCLVHGFGLGNMYRWKDTIGPIEQRREQPNIWGYHQTAGLGYFEYFQFCEDIGAMPLPVVPAAVCCQNANFTGGHGQRGLPLEQMPEYIQEVLDLIEWANGPADSEWGAKRAAAGHPEPFGLKYIGVGNEDQITPVFKERFKMIYEAVKAKHPEIVVIGTVGPFPDGEDFEAGWKFADELKLPMVDEHYYRPPQWFWDNLKRYDSYDRSRSKVYVGEYAAHDDRRRSTLRSALAESAYLTSLERNGDVVAFASYAPLLAKREHTHWNPDLIYFSNTEIVRTINYHVQQLFSLNSGDGYVAMEFDEAAAGKAFAASAVRDSGTGDLILKLVNGANTARTLDIRLAGVGNPAATATRTVLTGPNPAVVNDFGNPRAVVPQSDEIAAGASFRCDAPAHSLTVIRIGAR